MARLVVALMAVGVVAAVDWCGDDSACMAHGDVNGTCGAGGVCSCLAPYGSVSVTEGSVTETVGLCLDTTKTTAQLNADTFSMTVWGVLPPKDFLQLRSSQISLVDAAVSSTLGGATSTIKSLKLANNSLFFAYRYDDVAVASATRLANIEDLLRTQLTVSPLNDSFDISTMTATADGKGQSCTVPNPASAAVTADVNGCEILQCADGYTASDRPVGSGLKQCTLTPPTPTTPVVSPGLRDDDDDGDSISDVWITVIVMLCIIFVAFFVMVGLYFYLREPAPEAAPAAADDDDADLKAATYNNEPTADADPNVPAAPEAAAAPAEASEHGTASTDDTCVV